MVNNSLKASRCAAWVGSALMNILSGVPQRFNKLESDYGIFLSWKQIPEELRLPVDKMERPAREREAFGVTTGLQASLKISAPFKLKFPDSW
jgi:hypothetical protein